MSLPASVAVIPTELQRVSDRHSGKESNVTQMLYSSPPTRLTWEAKQARATATFNQMQLTLTMLSDTQGHLCGGTLCRISFDEGHSYGK